MAIRGRALSEVGFLLGDTVPSCKCENVTLSEKTVLVGTWLGKGRRSQDSALTCPLAQRRHVQPVQPWATALKNEPGAPGGTARRREGRRLGWERVKDKLEVRSERNRGLAHRGLGSRTSEPGLWALTPHLLCPLCTPTPVAGTRFTPASPDRTLSQLPPVPSLRPSGMPALTTWSSGMCDLAVTSMGHTGPTRHESGTPTSLL